MYKRLRTWASKNESWAVFVFSLPVYALQALAWPLAPGRDGYSYLYFWLDRDNPIPEDPTTLLVRTPVAPFFDYLLIYGLGPILAEIAMALVFGGVLVLYFQAARHWSRRIAWIFVAILAAHVSYGSLFHVFSNDPPVAILYALATWTMVRVAAHPTLWGYLSFGAITGLLVLTRPGIFWLMSLLPLSQWKKKTRVVLAVTATLLGLAPFVLYWANRNHQRYGKYALSIGTDVLVPFGRILGADKIVTTKNGPASAALGLEIEKHVLARDSTKRGVTADEYLRSASYMDVMALSDQVWPGDGYAHLRAVSNEALRAHFPKFALGVTLTFLQTVGTSLKLPVPLQNGAYIHTHKNRVAYVLDGRDRFVPLDAVDWKSIRRPDPPFSTPLLMQAYKKAAELPVRDGWIGLGRVLNLLVYAFPPLALWITLALAGMIWRLPKFRFWDRADRGLALLFSVGLLTNLAACIAMGVAVYQYRMPFDPVYILAALVFLPPGRLRNSLKFATPRVNS